MIRPTPCSFKMTRWQIHSKNKDDSSCALAYIQHHQHDHYRQPRPIKFCSDPFPCLPTSIVDMENPFHCHQVHLWWCLHEVACHTHNMGDVRTWISKVVKATNDSSILGCIHGHNTIPLGELCPVLHGHVIGIALCQMSQLDDFCHVCTLEQCDLPSLCFTLFSK